jgi:hypothetical protein
VTTAGRVLKVTNGINSTTGRSQPSRTVKGKTVLTRSGQPPFYPLHFGSNRDLGALLQNDRVKLQNDRVKLQNDRVKLKPTEVGFT